jgi:protein-S-isoprenylcysteine O-methyltransferase Ste14
MDWARGWFYFWLATGGLVIGGIAARRYNPGLIGERAKRHEGTKPFDKIFIRLHAPTMFLLPAIAGLDAVRFGWAPLPLWTVYPGLALFAAGSALVTWCAAVNPHLERTVRIQSDRGHRVIGDGPYRFVRHPMYLGVIFGNLAAPLILGSAWAFAVTGSDIALFVWRTAMEDRTLRAELAGYAEFAQRTPYRLWPGVW